MATTAYIKVKKEKCKGCHLCLAACAQGLIVDDEGEINALGYTPIKFVDAEDKCKGCKLCAEMCPDCCVEIYRVKKEKA